MQLTILQKNLHQGLTIVSHIAEKNLSMPILNNILIIYLIILLLIIAG